MQRPTEFNAELRWLNKGLVDLEIARDGLPAGAHIRALFEIAVATAEDRIASAHRLRAITPNRLPPS